MLAIESSPFSQTNHMWQSARTALTYRNTARSGVEQPDPSAGHRILIAKPTVSWIDYYSSVSGPPRLGVVILTVSYSVTRTTPGTGSSTTSMIVSSMTGTLCLPTFLGAFFAEVFRGRFFGAPREAAIATPHSRSGHAKFKLDTKV